MTRRIPPELLALRELFRTRDPAPERAVTAAYAARRLISQVNEPTERLTLIGDSADAPEPAPVRALPGARVARTLTFAVPGRIIELDLVPTSVSSFRGSGIVLSRAGRSVPAGTVALRHPGGQVTGDIDSGGGFEVDAVPSGPLSMAFRVGRCAPVVSDWLVC